ncbi:MAG: phosphate ABC transporter permease PstA [Pseudomonadota bacterium]
MIPINKTRTNYKKWADRLFCGLGLGAILFAIGTLLLLLFSIFFEGRYGFLRTDIKLEISLEQIPNPLSVEQANQINWRKFIYQELYKTFPEVTKRRDKKDLKKLISSGAGFILKDFVLEHHEPIGKTIHIDLPASSDVDLFIKHIDQQKKPSLELKTLNAKQIEWINTLKAQNKIITRFNWDFFTRGDSRLPELSGIRGGLIGSFWMLLITFLLSFPIGVLAAIYLEEYAKPGRLRDFIEININNLAAVPSIIFGLLGLALFLNVFSLPRSAPITGALVLTLMTLPTIIIAARASLKAVPTSIREAALGLGASHTQMVLHHLIPLAMPGTLTGTIIGMAQALGETAPLLMIGMVAFILEPSFSPDETSTALPVQIFLWADNPERGFREKTAAAIIVLLAFLILMNLAAVILRKKTEHKW